MAKKTVQSAKEQRAILTPTPASELRRLREFGAVLTFPSGNQYRITLPGIDGMLRRGNMPNPLLNFLIDAFYNGTTETKYNAFWSPKDREENVLELYESMRVVCQAMFLEPRVVDHIEDESNEVLIADIPLGDRQWAFRLLFAPVEEVYPFRPQPQTTMVSVSSAQDVPQVAEQRSGD